MRCSDPDCPCILHTSGPSDELMQRFSLLTATLTIGLIATLLWTGADLGSGMMRDAAVRIVTLEGSVLIAIAISIWSRGT